MRHEIKIHGKYIPVCHDKLVVNQIVKSAVHYSTIFGQNQKL
jgi:hypothetical protein